MGGLAGPCGGSWDGCPFCSSHRPTASTSLAAKFPDIAREWHPTKNGSLSPGAVLPASNKKVWWRCRRDSEHEWKAVLASRTRGSGCPYCSGHSLTPDRSLAAQEPRLAREWHPSKNGPLRPTDVSSRSARSVWWKCSRGPDHEWLGRISLRALGRGCPFCAGKKIGASNSLAARFPEIAARWHPTRNGRLRPTVVAPKSSRRAWWKCPVARDHEWEAVISSSQRSGCPFCAHRCPSSTYSLALMHPAIARQWHPTANGALTAKDVLPGSRTSRWWLCVSGHSWRAEPQARTYSVKRRQCPYCRLRQRRPVTKRVGERVLLPSDFR